MEAAYSSDTPFAYVGIGSLLSTPLTVPPNQRAYSWKAEQINDLLNDFEDAMAETDAEEREYFLGSIVITAADNDERPAIVDGQQRLASVTMIYAAIRDYLVEREETETAVDVEKEYLYSRHKWTKQKTARLRLSDQDAEFFERNVVARVGADTRQTKRGAKMPDSHKRMAKAFELIVERIRKIAQGSRDPNKVLQEWEEFLQRDVKVLVLMVRDESRAFQIFETLNDRGLELAIADLLKNYVFGKAGKRNFDQVRFQWNTAVTRLGGDAIVKRFIHHFWASKNGLVRERELYKRIRRSIRNERHALDFTVELAASADNYAAILNADSPVWRRVGTRGKECVLELKTLKMEQYKPLLLSCLDTFGLDNPNELKKVLELLVAWSVRFQATQELGSSEIERFYPEAAMAVREEKIGTATKLMERFASGVPADGVFRAKFQALTVENPQIARFYLRKLENRARSEGGRKEHVMIANEDIVSLEHILPQGADLALWPKFDEDEFKANLNRVGNLTLLLQDTNRDLSNLPFSVKRSVYQKQDALITRRAGEVEEWSPQAIEERQEWLADLAVREWPLRGTK